MSFLSAGKTNAKVFPQLILGGMKEKKLLNFACDWLQKEQIEWPQVEECGKKWEFSLSAQTEGRQRGGKAEKRKSINSDGPRCKCDFNVALKMQRFATPKSSSSWDNAANHKNAGKLPDIKSQEEMAKRGREQRRERADTEPLCCNKSPNKWKILQATNC